MAKGNLTSVLIKPESKEEKDYCAKHKISIIRLKNGITIVGVPHTTEDNAWAEINYEFPVGAFGNPPGHVHFLEHFFNNKKIRKVAHANVVNVNASTSQRYLRETSEGIANPNVEDFGTWKILKLVRDGIESPITLNKKTQGEKKVVIDEIKRSNSDHEYLVAEHFRKVVYARGNPLRNDPDVTGAEEDIKKITNGDLLKLMEKVLIPDGLLITAYTEGEERTAKIIAKKLAKLFEDFPRKGIKRKKIDRKILEQMNPEFKPGEVYLKETGIKNQRVTIEFVWILKSVFPNPQYYALKDLRVLIYTNLLARSREAGWGYYVNIFLNRPGDNISILSIRVDIHKGEDPALFTKERLLPEIKRYVLGKLNSRAIKDHCDLEAKKQKAVPLVKRAYLDWIVSGLEDYGQIINADKIKEIFTKIKPKDHEDYLDILLKTPPAIMITGDLE